MVHSTRCKPRWKAPGATAAVDLWQETEAQRKQPLRLATGLVARLGPVQVARYAAGRLSIEDALAALGAKIGVRAELATLPYPECGLDVDRPEHLAAVEGILRNREAPRG